MNAQTTIWVQDFHIKKFKEKYPEHKLLSDFQQRTFLTEEGTWGLFSIPQVGCYNHIGMFCP